MAIVSGTSSSKCEIVLGKQVS